MRFVENFGASKNNLANHYATKRRPAHRTYVIADPSRYILLLPLIHGRQIHPPTSIQSRASHPHPLRSRIGINSIFELIAGSRLVERWLVCQDVSGSRTGLRVAGAVAGVVECVTRVHCPGKE
jgi:hypothetical protein